MTGAGRAAGERALHVASICSLVLAPALVLQGRRVRRGTPRLPEAGGPRDGGCAGIEPSVRLLVLGESTAAGVGVGTHDEGLAGHIARTIATGTRRALAWMVRGRNGATAESTRTELLPEAGGFAPDVAVLVLGVNDTLQFRSPGQWASALDALIAALRARRASMGIVVAAVPPMGRFPALPMPLRGVLGLRARLLDRTAVRLVSVDDRSLHVPMPDPGSRAVDAFFCEDGFHPSSLGYAEWGRRLGEACVRLVTAA